VSGDGPTILVVDDNEDNRYTLTLRLRREGWETIVEAQTGRQALELLAERHFDLVLLDIMMPEMNGYEVLERIKSDMALRDIPVIMISAVDEIESVVRCIELGAEDYLPKPFNAVLLRARIGACLEKKRLRDHEASYLERLKVERRRADDLLHAVLPPGAVQELKTSNSVRPRRYEDVAVLFCDVAGFTAYCERNPPEQVVAELQALVERFEEIVDRHGMEKIKTVGDAFLATAGLLRRAEDPILSAVRCGLEMVEAARSQSPFWEVRVGIHHGPVVAGIIGRRQYLFDLWGDTINTAARIVAQAPVGAVVVSASIWLAIRNRCRGRSRGFAEFKGKGAVELVECLEVR
jgi:CheY-like chemotaxis protein